MAIARKRRPTTYRDWITEDGLIKLEGMARDGLVNEEIASQIGVHPSTLYEWQKKYPEIAEALKTGKEVVDRQVESALLKRALGYEYEEVKTLIEEVDGKKKKKVEKINRHVPGDTTAQIFWLKNRRNDRWSNMEASAQRKQSAEMLKMSVETELAEQRLKEMSAEKAPIMIEMVELERPNKKGQK